VYVCLSTRISLEPHAQSLPNLLCMLPMAVAQSDRVTESQGEGAILWVFPTDNALYSIAFGTHTRTAEPIEMPFGMMSGLIPRDSLLRGVTIPEGEGAIFGENMCLTSLMPLIIENWTGPCNGT